jgi:hypothetical protein
MQALEEKDVDTFASCFEAEGTMQAYAMWVNPDLKPDMESIKIALEEAFKELDVKFIDVRLKTVFTEEDSAIVITTQGTMDITFAEEEVIEIEETGELVVSDKMTIDLAQEPLYICMENTDNGWVIVEQSVDEGV